jgi:hypothetical protein
MEPDLTPLDLIDSGETFNPQCFQDWGLVVALRSYIWVNRQPKNPRYDQETEREPIDEA